VARNIEFPWERQPGEGEEAYEAFSVYYKAGLKRSLRKTADAIGKSRAMCDRWSKRWNWVERARGYDNALAREEYQATIDAIRKMNKQQASIGIMLQQKGLEALKKLNISKMDAKELLQFLMQGSNIERRARISDATMQVKQKEREENSTEYADDGLAMALESAAKKVWKK
jgi:uncharacterized membrane protein